MKIKTLLILSLALLIISCSSNSSKTAKDEKNAESEEILIDESPNNIVSFSPPNVKADEQVSSSINKKQTSSIRKKIIKDGDISIKSRDVYQSKKYVDTLIKKHHAYYDNENLENNDELVAYNLKIRIPSNLFERFLQELEKGDDEILNKNISTRDVTEEYIDVETRLNNKKVYLNRYRNLLSKANSIKDILAIEENIRNIQEEIESSEGRLKYLNDQVAFSTLQLNITKKKEYVYTPETQDNFFQRIKKSLSTGWQSLLSFFLGILSFWPFIILILIIYLVFKKLRKKPLK